MARRNPGKSALYRHKLGGWKLKPVGSTEEFVAERKAEREKVETLANMSPEKRAEMERLYGNKK